MQLRGDTSNEFASLMNGTSTQFSPHPHWRQQMTVNEKLRELDKPTGANIVRKIDLSKHKKRVLPIDTRKPAPERVRRDRIFTTPLDEAKRGR